MSPTLTAKSRAEPGVAGALRLEEPSSLSGLGVCEQALTANTTANAAAMRHDPASQLDSCMLMFPSFSRRPKQGIQCANGIFRRVSRPLSRRFVQKCDRSGPEKLPMAAKGKTREGCFPRNAAGPARRGNAVWQKN
jgi:hypothetical protein